MNTFVWTLYKNRSIATLTEYKTFGEIDWTLLQLGLKNWYNTMASEQQNLVIKHSINCKYIKQESYWRQYDYTNLY